MNHELSDPRQLRGYVIRLTALCVGMACILDLTAQTFVGADLSTIIRNQIQTVLIASAVSAPVIYWIALTNLKLMAAKAELLKLSRTDALTGILNRRAFLDEARQSWKPSTILVILDIDFFKKINDRFGHLAGDQVVCEIARRISTSFPGAVVSRFGGEEFAILFEERGELDVFEAVDDWRKRSEAEPIVVEGNPVRVTVSAGLAVAGGRDFQATYGAADAALYAAKSSGRNKAIRESEMRRLMMVGEVDWALDVAWLPDVGSGSAPNGADGAAREEQTRRAG